MYEHILLYKHLCDCIYNIIIYIMLMVIMITLFLEWSIYEEWLNKIFNIYVMRCWYVLAVLGALRYLFYTQELTQMISYYAHIYTTCMYTHIENFLFWTF